MTNTPNRTLALTPRQWQRLEQLAVETDSREPHGKGHDTRMAPTWQRMIRRIADGELHLVDPHPYALPPGLAEAAEAVEEREREAAVKRKTPVKMTQLNMLTELEPA